jgi:cephalosporin-C deacetylase-like acetyl esterase
MTYSASGSLTFVTFDFTIEQGYDLLFEGQGSHQQSIQYDSQTPHVHCRSFVGPVPQYFRRRVVDAATARAEVLAVLHEVAEAKVGYLAVEAAVE